MKASAYTPFDVKTKDRIVGFFVIGAILLFLLGFLMPYIQRIGTQEGIAYYTILDQTYGIAKEAQVSMRGVNIGKVTKIAITNEGMVRVDMTLSREYAKFYTLHSRLSVDSNIGVSTILTGSGLILHPSEGETEQLHVGDFIRTDPPGGITSLLQQLDVVKLTNQITDIVGNLDGITSGINQNQDKIYHAMDELQRVSASLAAVSDSLPDMVKNLDDSLVTLKSSLKGVDQLITGTDENLRKTLSNTVRLTDQATKTLVQAEVLFKQTTPVMQQLPAVLTTTNSALESITNLSDQMSQSWLLGGHSRPAASPIPIGLNINPHDDSLYGGSVDSSNQNPHQQSGESN
ncbi:MAG TPA: MlaD family protein [Pseudomonadales bacterium]|nr:MlaD family protein [Pseudomonadales bacterium]